MFSANGFIGSFDMGYSQESDVKVRFPINDQGAFQLSWRGYGRFSFAGYRTMRPALGKQPLL
jgi:hypothetical protein